MAIRSLAARCYVHEIIYLLSFAIFDFTLHYCRRISHDGPMFTEDCCKSNEGCDWSVLYANSLGLESEKFLALRWRAPLAPHWWRLFYSFVTKLQLVGTTGAHLSANENLQILKDGLFLLIYSYSYNDAYAIKLIRPRTSVF